MTEADGREFATVLIGVAEVYGETVSARRMELYCRALADLSLADIVAAAGIHVATSKWFPKPAELRELIQGNTEDHAELAWSRVQQEVRRVGWCGTPSWPDEATERAALQLFGGWRALCENLPSGGPELLGFRKQFVALYGAIARQDLGGGVLPPSREEARAVLTHLKTELAARHFPTKGL